MDGAGFESIQIMLAFLRRLAWFHFTGECNELPPDLAYTPFERQARVKSYTPSASYAIRLLVVQRGYTPPDLRPVLFS